MIVYLLVFFSNILYLYYSSPINIYVFIYLSTTNALGVFSSIITIYLLFKNKSEKFIKDIYTKKKPLTSTEIKEMIKKK